MAVLAEGQKRGAALLDLGCGPRDQAPVAEHLGLKYVGVDYDGDAADLLVDAHAIPFEGGMFDSVLSYSVLECLYDPGLTLQEVAWVLKPGETFLGAVSQGEPYHQSQFPHDPLGRLNIVHWRQSILSRPAVAADGLVASPFKNRPVPESDSVLSANS
ncbi:class I SAM-dependent methyltransferase [Alienimonas chondri]